MKAWEIRCGTLGAHELPPTRPADDEIGVRVSHSGICGSDLPKLLHPEKFGLPHPWRPGHEIVGVDPAGIRVAVEALMPCGACTHCASGDIQLCPDLRRLGWDVPGGFAEQVVVPRENAHPINGLDPLLAVLADPAAVAIHGLRCHHSGGPGRLGVIGAGTVGLLTALYGVRQGWDVEVIHRSAPHEATVQAVPVVFRSLDALPAQASFDVVVDAATGTDPAPLDLALRLVRDGGLVVVQNAYHPGVRLSTPLRDLFRRSIHLVGAFSYCRRQPVGDFSLALKLLKEHSTQISTLVAERGRLMDLAEIIANRPARSVRQVLRIDDALVDDA